MQSGLPNDVLGQRMLERRQIMIKIGVEAWESILRRYVKNNTDAERVISEIGNDLRMDRAFVIAFAKVRKSIDPAFAVQ